MEIAFVSIATLFGLLIGSFLNVVVWRVPRGESVVPDSRCASCGMKIRPWHNIPVLSWLWLRGKCAGCKSSISVRYPLVELATAVAFGAVTFWYMQVSRLEFASPLHLQFSWWLGLAGFLWFAAISIALTLIDLEHLRLPNAIVLPSVVVLVLCFGASAVLREDWAALVSVFGGSAVLWLAYCAIVLVYPRGIGGGDVKLAPAVGAVLGYVGWGAVLVGGFAAFVFGAIIGVLLMAIRVIGRKQGIPFGPYMFLGAWVGIFWGESLLNAYLGLAGLR